jgi:protease I
MKPAVVRLSAWSCRGAWLAELDAPHEASPDGSSPHPARRGGTPIARFAIGKELGMASKPTSKPTQGRPSQDAARRSVAFIVDQLFEDSEFQVPYERVREAGHEAVIIGLEADKKLKGKKGAQVTTQIAAQDVSAEDFDALVIPGGYSPDHLRIDPNMVELTREMFEAGKPVAAICHAGWMLVEADIATGRTVTSWPSIKTDLVNAGANWVDREVVQDDNLITSRKPDDLPAFTEALLEQLEHQNEPSKERRPQPRAHH